MNYDLNDKKQSVSWIKSKLIEQRVDAQFYKKEYVNNEIKIRNLNTKFLKDIYCKGDYGILPDSNDYCNKGIFLIRGTDLKNLFLDEQDLILVPNSYLDEKTEVKPKDILILIKGATIDSEYSVSIVPKIRYIAIFNGSIFRVRLKSEYNPYYVATFMSTKFFLKQKKRAISNTGIFYNDKESIENFIIPIPSPEIQKYIGDKVRKAEQLREEAKTLKNEAVEVFNQNYEQINKENNKFEWIKEHYLKEDNIIPQFYRQYDLLSDKKHEYIELESIVENIKCGIPVRSDMRIGDTYPFYGASGITDNIGDYNFDGQYLIVSQDGSIGSVNVARNKFWANNHVWVIQIKEGWDLEFLELYLNKYNYWISLTTGSVVPKVTSENLKKLLVPKINYQIQKYIGDKIRKAKHNEQNSKSLIRGAKKDVEDLIEGNFDMSKVKKDL